MIDLNKDMFVIRGKNIEQMETISRPSLSFWQDAWRRFRKNKAAFVGLCIILLYVLLIIGSAMGRFVCDSFTIGSILVRDIPYNLTFSMDIVYSPIFIYGLAKLLQCVKISWILKLLGELGKKSLVMWFVHCCFFSCCSPLTQKILYFPKNPILVTIFGLLLCYVAAVLFSYIIDPVLKRKNAFLRGGKKTAE